MTVEHQPEVPILENAWNQYAQLDALSKKQSRLHHFWRRSIFALSVFAVLIAVITQVFSNSFPAGMNIALKVLLIALLLAVSVLAAFLNKFDVGSDWRVFRAGAEEIQKEIYLYRTLLRDANDRQERLEQRLNDILNQMHRTMGKELILNHSSAKVPPYYDPSDPYSDEGYKDLTADDYACYRLENQLAEHIRKLQRYERERSRQQIYILAAGGVGILLAAFGGNYNIWVAFTSSLVAVLIGWQGLRNLDPVVKNYRRIVVELMNIYDRWNTLEPEERSERDFFSMVKSTEDVLWSQNTEYIHPMQDTLAGETLEKADLTDNNLLKMTVEADDVFKDQKQDSEVVIPSLVREELDETSDEQLDEVPVSLAEEALSELVQAEFAAMAEAAGHTGPFAIQADQEGTRRLTETLDAIAKEFEEEEIGRDTPTSVLNDLLSRYPTTNDVKG